MARRAKTGLLVFAILMVSLGAVYAREVSFVITCNLWEVYFPYFGADAKQKETISTLLEKRRKSNKEAIFVDCGNFSHPQFYNETSYTVAPIRTMKEVAYDAVNLGINEILLGTTFVKKWNEYLGAALVSNLNESTGQGRVVSSYRIIAREDIKIGIIGVTNKKPSGYKGSFFRIPDSFLQDIQNTIATAKKEAGLVVMLADIEQDSMESIIKNSGIPLLIVSEPAPDEASTTRMEGDTLLCRIRDHSIGILSVEYNDKNGTIEKFKYKEVLYDVKEMYPEELQVWNPERTTPVSVSDRINEYLPVIGMQIDNPQKLERAGIKGEASEMLVSDIELPEVLKQNSKVFCYIINENGETRRLYICKYRAGFGGPLFYYYIIFKGDGSVAGVQGGLAPTMAGHVLDITHIYESLSDKMISKWEPPLHHQGLAGFYENRLVESIRAANAMNSAFTREFPW